MNIKKTYLFRVSGILFFMIIFIGSIEGFKLSRLDDQSSGWLSPELNTLQAGRRKAPVFTIRDLSSVKPSALMKFVEESWNKNLRKGVILYSPDTLHTRKVVADGFVYTASFHDQRRMEIQTTAQKREDFCAFDNPENNRQILCELRLPSGRTWQVWGNYKPYKQYSLVFVLKKGSCGECPPQENTKETIEDLMIMRRLFPAYIFLYNNEGSGNSQKHFHFQAYKRDAGAGQLHEKPVKPAGEEAGLCVVQGWLLEAWYIADRNIDSWAVAAVLEYLSNVEMERTYNISTSAGGIYIFPTKNRGLLPQNGFKAHCGALDASELRMASVEPVSSMGVKELLAKAKESLAFAFFYPEENEAVKMRLEAASRYAAARHAAQAGRRLSCA